MVSKEFLKSLPENPGIYIMKNKEDKIIYVGKAKNLKNRVNQYFVNSSGHTPKVKAMVSHIEKIEYIITNSENEALNLECSLIKKHRPKYNILLKDDKEYPYIKITDEAFPRVLYAHRVENDKARYFGPFISVYAVNHMIEAINKMFLLRECKGNVSYNEKNKPCLNFHINKCCGPCIGKITKEEYNEKIKNAISVLSGNIGEIISDLEEQMNLYAEKLDFENAALTRDKITRIKKMNERQIVIASGNLDEDVVCLYKEDGNICIQMMYVREGRLIDKKAFFINANTLDEDREIINAFIKQYYSQFTVPKNILVSCEPEEKEELEAFLSEKRGNRVKIYIPQRGDKYNFIIMAKKNASEAIKLREKRYSKKENTQALIQLKEYLSLKDLPEKIEAFDISNTAGKETVASMVVFVNGVPEKSLYRKFKIKSDIKGDDYTAMREAVKRRIERAIDKKDDKFKNLPALIFADGGKGQVNAIKEVLKEKGLSIPVFGLVKDDRHHTRDITDDNKEYNIPKGTKCFRLCVSIQDEMHRMAITYHRTLRDKKNKESQLMLVPGIGKAKYKALMTEFKTISAVKSAKIEDLIRVKGITEEIAKNILKIL